MKTCAYLDVKVRLQGNAIFEAVHVLVYLGLHMARAPANPRTKIQDQACPDAILSPRLHDVQVGGYSVVHTLLCRCSLVDVVFGG